MTYHCPVSHVYLLEGGDLDGRHVMVTVKNPAELQRIFQDMVGVTMMSHIKPAVEVFFCNEDASEIYDADGDPLNGLTAYASTDDESFRVVELTSAVKSHVDALAALGYTLTEQEPTDVS